MKLSLQRKPGWIQVRGGRLRRVIGAHAVRTATQSELEKRRAYTTDWVTAERGDLAIEIVCVANGNTLGHAYISGKAIGLNGYSSSETWFADAVALHADMQPLIEMGTERIAAALLEIKHCSQGDLVVLGILTSGDDESKEAMESVMTMFSYAQEPGDGVEPLAQTADVFVIIGPGRGKKGKVYTIHSQAPTRAQEFSAAVFVMELAAQAGYPPMAFGAWDPDKGVISMPDDVGKGEISR